MQKPPVLSHLRTFVTAAKTGSFANTAVKLCITPAAVSQQIRQLENQLESILFERSKRGVCLTQAGIQYLVFAEKALDNLRQGQHCIDQLKNQQYFTIRAFPSVASKWLMPKIIQFMDLNPDLEIRLEASHSKVDFDNSETDACISFGHQDYQNEEAVLLFNDSVSLVASPLLLQQLPNNYDLNILLQQPFIQIDWGDFNGFLPGWEDWLKLAGYKDIGFKKGPQFNLSNLAIEAAIQGKGLLLGQKLLIQDELKSGALIQVSDISLPLEHPYYLVYPKRTLAKPQAIYFIKQLIDDQC